MILVDSCGWIEVLANGPLASDYQKLLANTQSVITPTIVMYEVYKKISKERGSSIATLIAATMMKTKVIPLTDDLALSAAEKSLELSLPMADAIVYATALAHKCQVATSDAHFDGLDHVIFVKRSSG